MTINFVKLTQLHLQWKYIEEGPQNNSKVKYPFKDNNTGTNLCKIIQNNNLLVFGPYWELCPCIMCAERQSNSN